MSLCNAESYCGSNCFQSSYPLNSQTGDHRISYSIYGDSCTTLVIIQIPIRELEIFIESLIVHPPTKLTEFVHKKIKSRTIHQRSHHTHSSLSILDPTSNTMPRDHRRGRRGKRGFRQVENREDDEETVDDLAHAAQFALFPAPAVAEASVDSGGNTKEDDDNEIEVSEEKDDDDDSDASIDDAADKEEDSDGSSSDDDESDDDLAEALERMERASAEEEAKSATTSSPPKTENEVDGYKVPIQELESQLQMQLTVEGGTNASTKNGMDISTNEVSLAGKIKNYMVLDRTVVVESISNAPSSQNAIGPLDEGSLLVVKNPNGDEDNAEAGWIPLGRIFEVFGPVSQPLYTIRLPSPPKEPKKAPAKSTKTIPKNGDPKEDRAKEAEDQTDEDSNDKTTPVAEAEGETTNSSEMPHSDEQKPTDSSPNPTTESENANTSCPNTVEKSISTDETKNADSMVTDETPNNDTTEAPLSDPWAKDGAYAKFLSENRNIEVYYIQDEAKIIDTGLVLRTSGKGCDASNIYDEEIMDASEAYYSDDEKEREAKNKKKGNRKKKQQGSNGNRSQGNQHRARNFHQPQQFQHNAAGPGQHHFRPPPPPPPPQNYGYSQHHPSGAGSLPTGFHPVSQHGGFAQQPSTLYQYPAQSAFRGQSSMPPPPPPPPPQNQHYPYQGTAPASSMPPPPPPPRNPNEPPAYQY